MWKRTTTSIDPSSSMLIHNSPLSIKSCSSTGYDSLENFMSGIFAEDEVAAPDNNNIVHTSNTKNLGANRNSLMIPDLKSSTINPIAFQQNQREPIYTSTQQQPKNPPSTISFTSPTNTTSASVPAPSSALLQKIDSNNSIMMQYDCIQKKNSAKFPSYGTKTKVDRDGTTTITCTNSVLSCRSSSSSSHKKKRSRKCPKDQYTQVSYENKKLRAKENRAKLTEAINRLEGAFRQAQNGSEQRSQSYKQHHLSLSSSQDTMNDVIQIAKNSHKWDRPSFIMSAADIVTKLNDQCQALMQDLLQLKKESSYNKNEIHVKNNHYYKETNTTETYNKADQNNQFCNVRTLPRNITSGCGIGHNSSRSSQLIGMNNTVIQMDETFKGSTISLLDIPDSIIKEIAYFLDPKSLLRCRRVTKLWSNVERNSMVIFAHDDLWLDLCIHRYGSSQVQKWKNTKNYYSSPGVSVHGKADDHNNNSDYTQQHCSMMKMYRDMDVANWKPSWSYDQRDLYLGDAKLKLNNLPILSAWVSIVDRSNGETMRTVFANLGASEQILLIPVVEVRILLQNTGLTGQSKGPILIPEQTLSIESIGNDGDMIELQSDKRLTKRVITRGKGGSSPISSSSLPTSKFPGGSLCYLNLYEVVELRFHVHASSCLSTKEFVRKAKSLKLLANILGNTVPFHIPFQSQ